MSYIKSFRERLFKPVDSITAEIFAKLFGVIVLLQAISFQKFDFINKGILEPKFLFTYDFFEWVKPLPKSAMQLLLPLLVFSAILIIINKLRKIGVAIFVMVFSYLFLLEKSYYNNHFYLLILVGVALLFYKPVKNADTGISYIPYWFLFFLQFHIALVYFYGGLVKLNPDWLVEMQPMKTLLAQSVKNAAIPSINKSALALYLLTYGGVLFDLCIPFLLWMSKTRKFAIIACVAFNVFNFLLFNFGTGGDIGVFPFFMMGACILFVNPQYVREKIKGWFPPSTKVAAKGKKQSALPDFAVTQKIVMPLLTAYCVFHLLFPFRHLLFDGNTRWTGKAARFAWRMKAHTKKSDIKYYFALTEKDTLKEAQVGMLINTMQRQQLAEDPAMILQLANFLGNDLKKAGYNNPVIKTTAMVSLNGREQQLLVDSTLNLLALKHNKLGSDEWVLPLKE